MDRVDLRTRPEVDLGGSSVEAGDAMGPHPVEQVGVVAVAQEGFRIGHHEAGIEVRDDSDLVLAADGGQHRADLGIGERGVQVRGPLSR
jgi:hypothetical protein